MEDQVYSTPTYHQSSDSPSQKSGKKGLVTGIIVVLLLAGVGAAAYFAGKNSGSQESPTPTQNPIKEILLTETPTPSLIPTSGTTGTITPTKKISATPTITPTPTPIIKSKILSSNAALDGFRSSNNGGNSTLDVRVGRNSNLVTRGFISFDITSIPAGAVVTEVTLRLYQAKIIGSPFASGGTLKIDHLTYGDSLDSSDYGLAALSSSFATVTSNPTLEWKDVVVTDRVKNDLSNARGTSQFRIHFTSEVTGGDVTGDGDFAYFESADNSEGTGNAPQLVVKYY